RPHKFDESDGQQKHPEFEIRYFGFLERLNPSGNFGSLKVERSTRIVWSSSSISVPLGLSSSYIAFPSLRRLLPHRTEECVPLQSRFPEKNFRLAPPAPARHR